MVSMVVVSGYGVAGVMGAEAIIGWQSLGFDKKMQHGIMPLTGMQPGDFMYFSAYAMSGFMHPISFLFMVLEYYGLQLQHLSLQSIMLMAIFVHLCEMYVCVWVSVRLFRRLHVMHSAKKSPSPLGGCYFQHRAKGRSTYITTLSLDKWDCWRED
jgi:hypothetical protein